MKKTIPLVISGVSTAAFMFSGCNGGAGPDDNPAFDNVSAFAPLYVAYLSPDRFEKSDTVKLSFDCNTAVVRSIEVTATLDSGASWFGVTSVTPPDSKHVSISWLPLSDPVHFSYFGLKQCRIKIEDPLSGTGISTDPFNVIGNVPFMLTAPIGGERFRVSDSIHVFLTQNQDLTAQLKVFVYPNADDDGTNVSLKYTPLPDSWEFLRYYEAIFSLDDPKFNYDGTVMPEIRILVADYGVQVIKKESGPITIIP